MITTFEMTQAGRFESNGRRTSNRLDRIEQMQGKFIRYHEKHNNSPVKET